jgi:AraC-like DNA-binding protein
MTQDPFSSILSVMNARAAAAGGFTAGGHWALRFPPPEKIKFFVMARGDSVLLVDGIAAPFVLREGDAFLLQAGAGFVIASDPHTLPRDAMDFFDADAPEVVDLGGSAVLFLGGHIDLDLASGDLLLSHLPATIHLPGGKSGTRRLGWLIEAFVREQTEATVGADQACAAIAQLIFLEVLRAYVAEPAPEVVGWLRGMGDARLEPALGLIHAEPAGDWSVAELARRAGMSRTAFAVRFKAIMGLAPLTYLTDWRMRLARRGLADGIPIATLAPTLGYASEAAFSAAFKRVAGVAPKFYRRMALNDR